jgi:hypothetical protein
MALIQFRIWESGRIDMKRLSQLLRSAISHALWDTVLEYKILPSPLCYGLHAAEKEEDKQETEKSPVKEDREESSVAKDGEGVNRQQEQQEPAQEVAETSHNSYLSLKRLSQDAVLAYGGSLLGAGGGGSAAALPKIVVEAKAGTKGGGGGAAEEVAAEALSLPNLLRPPAEPTQLEAGRRGRLSAAYTGTVWDWARLGRSLGAPAYQEFTLPLYAKPGLAALIEELLVVVQAVLPDFDLRIFGKQQPAERQQASPDDGWSSAIYLPSTEQLSDLKPTAAAPGEEQSSDQEFIVMGRSLRLWKACVSCGSSSMGTWATELLHLRNKFGKQFQNFPPLLLSTGNQPARSAAVPTGGTSGEGQLAAAETPSSGGVL